ncbi:hypothetical protein SH1V18_27410 [Vallitalea longa]|uniref:TM7S3/TM198-like domain-containing protein n=1 Tax=Vallitalea longa TaxID=2936439 RepID=A0A9W5YCP5_9FIRM|nr:DUF4203 domain-containing protein [Vallitalea longa]GKX30261.1 hypothetical protein SH1V18_27410 [Vallitalea longa]
MLSVIVTLIYLACLGLLFCFMGRKLFYPLLNIGCFFGGIAIGFSLFDTTLGAVISGVVLGIIFALLTKFLYKTSLALSGAVLGFLISFMVVNHYVTIEEPLNYIICISVGLVFAILFVVKSDLFIIISTSCTGASLLGTIGVFLFQNYNNLSNYVYADGFIATATHLNEYLMGSFSKDNSIVISIVTVIVFIMGFIAQNSKEKK